MDFLPKFFRIGFSLLPVYQICIMVEVADLSIISRQTRHIYPATTFQDINFIPKNPAKYVPPLASSVI